MADESDDAQRTEEPTQRRLDEAREKGQIAASREVNHWFMILASTVIVAVLAPGMARAIGASLQRFLAAAAAIPTDLDHLRGVVLIAAAEIGAAVLIPVGLLLAAAVLAPLLQHGIVIAGEQIMPQLDRISPIKGARRLFSARALSDFAKGLAKLAVVGAVGTALLWPALGGISGIVALAPADALVVLHRLTVRLLAGVVAVMTAVALLDVLYQKYEHRKRLRMTRQELREEFKQTEGDPTVKARLRQIRMERARRRMMAAVPEADVVVTNPTHFAVALRYEAERMSAPQVTAKGVDSLARRIREVAEAHAVPVVENPPLAQGLCASVEVGDEIPPEHYKAVAQVIGYVLRLKGRPLPARSGAR